MAQPTQAQKQRGFRSLGSYLLSERLAASQPQRAATRASPHPAPVSPLQPSLLLATLSSASAALLLSASAPPGTPAGRAQGGERKGDTRLPAARQGGSATARRCTQPGPELPQCRPAGTPCRRINSFPRASSRAPASPAVRVPCAGMLLQLPSLLVISSLD